MGSALGKRSLGTGFGILTTAYGVTNALVPYVAGRLYATDPKLPFLVAVSGIPATVAATIVVALVERRWKRASVVGDMR
jgi:formate-dependent nitrite reductase membrane component NrfD